jgi:hypothetical protein
VLAQGLWISLKLVEDREFAVAGIVFVAALGMAIYFLGAGHEIDQHERH